MCFVRYTIKVYYTELKILNRNYSCKWTFGQRNMSCPRCPHQVPLFSPKKRGLV